MSATPIPRTLSLFLFNEENISVIEGFPLGRKKINTIVLDYSYEKKFLILSLIIQKKATRPTLFFHQLMKVMIAI